MKDKMRKKVKNTKAWKVRHVIAVKEEAKTKKDMIEKGVSMKVQVISLDEEFEKSTESAKKAWKKRKHGKAFQFGEGRGYVGGPPEGDPFPHKRSLGWKKWIERNPDWIKEHPKWKPPKVTGITFRRPGSKLKKAEGQVVIPAHMATVHGKKVMVQQSIPFMAPGRHGDYTKKVHTTEREEGGKTHIKYHTTDVVSFDSNEITLRDGGWMTSSTKKRINQASTEHGLGISIFQHKNDWFVAYKGKTIPFRDEMTINRERGDTHYDKWFDMTEKEKKTLASYEKRYHRAEEMAGRK
jgi:hypothetical protein